MFHSEKKVQTLWNMKKRRQHTVQNVERKSFLLNCHRKWKSN